jgi:hypothetical protein
VVGLFDTFPAPFVKQSVQLGASIPDAATQYAKDVRQGVYPQPGPAQRDRASAPGFAESNAGAAAARRGDFRTGATRSAAWREGQLTALRAMLTDRVEDFYAALWTDPRRNRTDADLTDVEYLASEADHALSHLRQWLQPLSVSTPLGLEGARVQGQFDPLGVGLTEKLASRLRLVALPWGKPLFSPAVNPGLSFTSQDIIATDTANASITGTSNAIAVSTTSVAGPGPINGTGVPVTGFEFTPLNNVVVATFTSGDGSTPADQFSAIINWGDGTPQNPDLTTGTVTLSGGTYSVLGSHTYQDEGTFPITVTVSAGTVSATIPSSATIGQELLPNGMQGNADQNFIAELYRDLLHRQVDPVGLANATNALAQGVSRTDIILGIVNSVEYRTDEVNALYEKYLGRQADSLGLGNALTLLNAGGTYEEVAAGIVGSLEYFERNGGTIDGFLTAFDRDALGQPLDPTGQANGEAFLTDQGGGEATLEADPARIQFALNLFLVQDPSLPSSVYQQVLVESFYQQFLGRPADPLGLAQFSTALQQGVSDETVIAMLLGNSSNEYYNRASS